MKLRIQNDAIRLRLTVSEVGRIGAGQSVVATTRFPGGAALTYALVTTREPDMSASLEGQTLTVRIPQAEAQAWAGDDGRVSLACEPDEAHRRPALLVEKDFACLAPRPGDEGQDLFVNPRAATGPKPTPAS